MRPVAHAPSSADPNAPVIYQQDGRICAGWAGCHDMDHNLAARVAVLDGRLTPDEYQRLLDYAPGVPLFGSGQSAAAHGLADEKNPGQRARQMARKLRHRQTLTAQEARSGSGPDRV